MARDCLDRSLDNDPAPVPSGPRSQVDDVIGGANRLLIVLHHEHCIAQIAQTSESVQEAGVVPRMQSHGRLIQDIEDTHQSAADLSRQPNPLRLAGRERRRRPTQGEIVESNITQEPQPITDFL